MTALRSELARLALRDHAQPRLARGEMGKARHAAERSRGPCEEDGAATERHKTACRLTAYQESAERVQAPEVLESRGVHLPEIDLLVVAGIIGDEIGGTAIPVARYCGIEQPGDVLLPRRIYRKGGRAAPPPPGPRLQPLPPF